jgi:chaperonin GroES
VSDINDTGISPVEFKVLVRVVETEEKTKGGIYIPQDTKERNDMAGTDAVLLAVGGNAFTNPDWIGVIPKPGDKVKVAKYAGLMMKDTNGRDMLRLCNDKDISAVLS